MSCAQGGDSSSRVVKCESKSSQAWASFVEVAGLMSLDEGGQIPAVDVRSSKSTQNVAIPHEAFT